MSQRWRGFVATIVLCLLTMAAIVVSLAAVLGVVDKTGLAAGLGLVAFVQLCFLITNRQRAAAGAAVKAPHVSDHDASAVASQDVHGEDETAAQADSEAIDTGPTLAPVAANDTVNGTAATTANDTTDETADDGAATITTGIDILDQGQLDLQLEPVVELAETRTVYYRASLVLTRQDGSRLGPYLLALTADRGGFAPALDVVLFRRVALVIRHLKARNRRPGVFCPLSPHSYGERDVLDELVQYLRANKDAAGAMVIELSQPALAALSPAGMEGLAYLAELGATLSLSEARLEGPDLATLALLGFRFIDLDIASLASTHGWDAFGEHGEVCRLARHAEQAGLTVIAANVVRSEELERVRAFARLARGSLFSPPRAVRRDITGPVTQAAAA